jgi:hypothetical protein
MGVVTFNVIDAIVDHDGDVKTAGNGMLEKEL